MPDLHEQALAYSFKHYPKFHLHRHHAFANSVVYLVKGYSAGIGPSVREHLCSWALAGDGDIGSTTTALGKLTMITPDPRFPLAGEWEYERAVQFCEPIIFGPLPKLARRVIEQEAFFNDDPEDIQELIKVVQGELLLAAGANRAELEQLLKKLRAAVD